MKQEGSAHQRHKLLVQRLTAALTGELPGESAHTSMIPLKRGYTPAESVSSDDGVRQGAVLLLLVPGRTPSDTPCNSVEIPLIQRTLDDGPHSGQIALPGGAEEPTDAGPIETAIREAHEEIGIDPRTVTPVGTLTPLYIDVSAFVITPVVAVLTQRDGAFWNTLTPQESEVARIIPASLGTLIRSKENRSVRARGYRFTVPSYLVDDDIVWGATAMIIAELIEVCATAINGAAHRYRSAGSW